MYSISQQHRTHDSWNQLQAIRTPLQQPYHYNEVCVTSCPRHQELVEKGADNRIRFILAWYTTAEALPDASATFHSV